MTILCTPLTNSPPFIFHWMLAVSTRYSDRIPCSEAIVVIVVMVAVDWKVLFISPVHVLP